MVVIPEIYKESGNFDPNTMQGGVAEDGFAPNCNFDEQSNFHQNLSQQDAAAAMEMELQHQLNMDMQQLYNNNNQNENHLVLQEMMQQSNWDHDMSYNSTYDQAESFNADPPYPPPTPDLINMFPLPRCSTSSLLPNSIFPNVDGSSASASAVVYDPLLLPFNLPPQPPLLRDVFHSLPHGSLFSGGVDDGGCFYQDGGDGRASFANGVAFEFSNGVKGKDGKDTKHFATERQRRVQWNDKYKALRSLIPNPTKNDRASVVGDAIGYINELKRTVNELKILVEKKRCNKERTKRQTAQEAVVDDIKNGTAAFRSSWLHRKSKNTEVDVRIIDDEVTVKLVQQKRINCLLFVSKVLDELQLDLHHVAGGLIGDYYSFLFNSKISEGSTVYAHAIANKLIEVVDKQYAAIPPINSY